MNIAYGVIDSGTSGGETSSHISIQAVAYNIVPEPGTYALLAGCLAFASIAFTRRCKRG